MCLEEHRTGGPVTCFGVNLYTVSLYRFCESSSNVRNFSSISSRTADSEAALYLGASVTFAAYRFMSVYVGLLMAIVVVVVSLCRQDVWYV